MSAEPEARARECSGGTAEVEAQVGSRPKGYVAASDYAVASGYVAASGCVTALGCVVALGYVAAPGCVAAYDCRAYDAALATASEIRGGGETLIGHDSFGWTQFLACLQNK